MVKKGWNRIPWNEAEYWIAILQNSLYKSSKRKDSFHKFKIQNKIGLDPRTKLLTLRKILDENGFFSKQNFYNKKVENDPNLQLIIFDFLKLKKLSSLQKFKLASMSSPFFSEKDSISFSPKQSFPRSSVRPFSREEQEEQRKQRGFPFAVPEGVSSGNTKVYKIPDPEEVPLLQGKKIPFAVPIQMVSRGETKAVYSHPRHRVSEVSILYWDSVFPEQGRSFNRLFLNKKFQRKELIFLFERIFQVFPSKKSLQAFQFCCFLQLSNEELSTFIFEPELEPLLEPNLQPSSFFSNEIKTLVHKKKGKKSFFLLNKGFYTLLSNLSQKKIFSKGRNNVPFLFSGFLCHSFCPFLIKIFSHFITNLTLYGFIRIKGFFGKFSGWLHKNISSNKKKNYQQKILFEPFLLSGLEFDIKKWQKNDKGKKNKISNTKTLLRPAKVSKHFRVSIYDGIDRGNIDTLMSTNSKNLENSKSLENSTNFSNSSILSNSICYPPQGGKKQEIRNSTNWFKKTKIFSKNKFFFLLHKTRFLFFSTRIESQISAPYCGPGYVQNSETLTEYSHPILSGSDRVSGIDVGNSETLISGINPFFGFSFDRFISDWFSKKIFIKSFTSSTLVKGIEFQNHVVRAYPNFFFRKNVFQKKRSSTLFKKKSSQRLVGCSFLKKRKKNVQSVKNFYKIKIFPCKNYQQRLVATLQELISQKRGNSAKSLIFPLGSILKSWNSSLCSFKKNSKFHKILRRIDSIVHLQVLNWTYKCHPNWNCKKIIEKYFPKKKIYVFQGFTHKENWIFSDSFQDKKFFLLRLSWFHRKKGNQKKKSFGKIIYSGVF
jgi:hypothetical protein